MAEMEMEESLEYRRDHMVRQDQRRNHRRVQKISQVREIQGLVLLFL
jgi:hypothetical protein